MASITGVAETSSGTLMSGCTVFAYNRSSGALLGTATTASDGTYTLSHSASSGDVVFLVCLDNGETLYEGMVRDRITIEAESTVSAADVTKLYDYDLPYGGSVTLTINGTEYTQSGFGSIGSSLHDDTTYYTNNYTLLNYFLTEGDNVATLGALISLGDDGDTFTITNISGATLTMSMISSSLTLIEELTLSA